MLSLIALAVFLQELRELVPHVEDGLLIEIPRLIMDEVVQALLQSVEVARVIGHFR